MERIRSNPAGRSMTGWVIVALLGIVGVGVWVVDCWWFPFAACTKCKGGGRFRSRLTRTWRDCPKCGGGGRRIRPARVMWKKISGR